MPLPRYQPLRKKPKVNGPSINDIDDYCLSKIIGYTLKLSSPRDSDFKLLGDNGRTEKNLSLVSKRWYYLTQTQIATCGVHLINLDKISRSGAPRRAPGSTSALAKRPGILLQKNIGCNSVISAHNRHQQQQQQQLQQLKPEVCNIDLFRIIQPKLLKYKHIQINGNLSCDELKKFIVALDAARVEQLDLKIKIEKDGTSTKEFAIMPKQLRYLTRLSLFWQTDIKSEYSNGITWSIFERATNLKTLEIHLSEDLSDDSEAAINRSQPVRRESKGRASSKFLDKIYDLSHLQLAKIVFNRSLRDSQPDCGYTQLIQRVLAKEDSIHHVDTNDNMLIEYLIKSSDRICTTRELKLLKFSSPIRNMDLLMQLLKSKNLGSEQLSIVIDDADHLGETRLSMEHFKLIRDVGSLCHLSVHIRDQKFSDCEEKIKNLVHLSRLAEVTVNISAQQRVSIDCCHLMWSIGRALQSADMPGKCLFKITLQALPQRLNSYTQITVPFGRCLYWKINSQREDLVRHREIMKSLKRDCYHQFVKSVRDNIMP